MQFSHFSQFLSKMEATSSRLEITKILSKLISQLTESELSAGVFLSLGTIGPGYEDVEFGISEKLMLRIIARAFNMEEGTVLKRFKSVGDLGMVAQEFRTKNKELITTKAGLLVDEVFKKLKEVVETTGNGSVEKKINLMANLLQGLDDVSARFVVRIPLGTMRLGFSEKTILESLALLESGETEPSFSKGSKSREIKEELESRYNAYPNIGEITKSFRLKGLKGLGDIQVRVGVPISPQLCARLDTAEQMVEKAHDKNGNISAEYKYDGMRLQVHIDRNFDNKKSEIKNRNLMLEGFGETEDGVRMYTRNFEQMQIMFPDLKEAFLSSINAKSVILDGEAVGFDPKTGKFIPFQETIQRKRKYNVAETIKKIPVKYFAFDILFKDGKDLTTLSYAKRREILLQTIKKNEVVLVTESFVTKDSKDLANYFKKAKEGGLEGLIIKNPESSYEAGSRGFSWVKFKRENDGGLTDTLDCVVLGYYVGTGKRAGFGIGAFLVGIYDDKEDKFITIAKIGTGLTDEEWKTLKSRSQELRVKELPKNVEIPKGLTPDVLWKPEVVVMIRADEISISPLHSSGYALRFPRIMGYRQDKKAVQATSLSELKQMYKLQEKH